MPTLLAVAGSQNVILLDLCLHKGFGDKIGALITLQNYVKK